MINFVWALYKLNHDYTVLTHSLDDGAELTIIAASGSDPNYGLPGVSCPRKSLPILTIQNHIFVAMEEPKTEIDNSRWNTRAWTYQEGLLSRRRLVFTDTQTYFQCRTEHFVEGLDCRAVWRHSIPSFQAFPERGIGTNVLGVFDRLQEYYRKDVSFGTDTISAFSGIFQAFQHLGPDLSFPQTNHIYGIPMFCEQDNPSPDEVLTRLNTSFALGLAWKVFDCQYPDRQSPFADTDELFPSWSWAAFKARRCGADAGRLEFQFRGYAYHSEIDRTLIDVRTHHREGSVMNLLDYIHHGGDYVAFEPRIDITSIVIEGNLLRDDRDIISFSACPAIRPRRLHLHETLEELLGNISLVYVGAVEQMELSSFAFILAKSLSNGHYRHVGVLSHSARTSDVFAYPYMYERDAIGAFRRMFESNGGEWSRKTITLV